MRSTFFLLCVTLALGFKNPLQAAQPDTLSVRQLNQLAPKKGTFSVKGYVVKHNTCPPCPKGALCEPCAPNGVVLSDNPKLLDNFQLSPENLIVNAADPERLLLGKRYELEIKIEATRTTSQSVNDVTLIKFTEVSAPGELAVEANQLKDNYESTFYDASACHGRTKPKLNLFSEARFC